MLDLITSETGALENSKESDFRKEVMDFEGKLASIDGAVRGDNALCPLKHSFTDGIYIREISIPKGTVLTGKIHKHAHPNFLVKGVVEMVTESGGKERLEGPVAMISKPGTKRAIHILSDCTWITIHHNPTNTQDLKKLEKIIIASSYEDYERFIAGEKNIFIKIGNAMKNLFVKPFKSLKL